MAAELITPIDKLSGLPLPILPIEDCLPLENPEIANLHHGFFPASELKETIGGTAVRNSWVQLINVELHNFGPLSYHRFYKGPRLPQTELEQFKVCLWACTGYVPPMGIDLTHGEPNIKPIVKEHQAYFSMMHPENPFLHRHLGYMYGPIRRFFQEYVVKQDLSHVRQHLVEELIDERTTEERRSRVALHLIALATDIAVEPVRRKYATMLRKKQLHPLMPATPYTLLKHKLGTPARRLEMVPRLIEELEGQFSIAA